jgi:transposase
MRIESTPTAVRAFAAASARDSGQRAVRGTIGGGRPIVRTRPFIADLHASRRAAAFSAFRVRLLQAGNAVRAAIAATARKLPTVLDAMLEAGPGYRTALLE